MGVQRTVWCYSATACKVASTNQKTRWYEVVFIVKYPGYVMLNMVAMIMSWYWVVMLNMVATITKQQLKKVAAKHIT